MRTSKCTTGFALSALSVAALIFHCQPTARAEDRATGIRPVQLKSEHSADPLGIEAAQPRFGWVLESHERGQLQTAYQILVASSLQNLLSNNGDKWNSGKIVSDNSVEVTYQGKSLSTGERCYWKVRVWDKSGKAGSYSAPSLFEMGLLKQSDWHGKWIGAKKGISSPLLRREFLLQKTVRRARVYVSGVGYYEFHINGKKVGDRVLDPASTYYTNDQPFKLNARVLYASYDVTRYLATGPNAIGVMLGHGWYSSESDVVPAPAGRTPYGDCPRAILQMHIDFADGQRMSLETDGKWRVSSGPITYNDLFHGETYDARLEQPGWDSAGFDDTQWEQAVLAEPPGGALTAQVLPPAQVVQTIIPVRMLLPKEPYMASVYIYDFGQNFSGWAKIRLSGPRGAKLTLTFGARIYPEDSTLDNRSNLRFGGEARQTDTYILKGAGTEEWEPRFTLHGFRYVEVRGFQPTIKLEGIEGRFVRSSVDSHGRFACSNSLLNKIHHNIQWAFMSSFQGMPQDASDRSERVAWLGDPGFVAEDYIYNYDMRAFWEKWLDDIRDSQKDNGDLPIVSPIHWRNTMNPYQMKPAWKSTYPLLIWYLYGYYGDKRVLENHYESLKELVAYLGTTATDYRIVDGLGDHMEPQDYGYSSPRPLHTPIPLTSTAYYYYDTWILSQVAEILGKADDTKRYSELARSIKEAFNLEFFDKGSNQYGTGSQTSNALPLYFQMVSEENVDAVVKNLVYDIVAKHQGHLSTGIIGLNALAQTLPRYGAASVMYQIVTQTTYPSLGYQVSKGATALWETMEDAPWTCQNMKMFGSVEKFFYRNLAGIGLGSSGYRRILISPQPVGELRSVSASLKTVRGTIAVDWVKAGASFKAKVSVPVGSEADISIPKLGLRNVVVTEGGTAVWKGNAYVAGTPGLTSATESTECITFHAGSGSYEFRMSGV